MNNKQLRKVNMFDSSLTVLTYVSNKPIWIGNSTFSTAVSNIQTNLGVLNSADAVKLSSSQPITETKGQTKVNLIDITMQHAIAGAGYATTIGNNTLKATCTITESSLVNSADADLGNACMNIYTTVQPVIGGMADWAVDATTLAALLSDINTFNSLVGAPVAHISIQNAASTDIDTQITTIETIFADKIDTLMNQFKVNHAAFYNGYFSARKVHNTGVHHSTTFEGFVYKADGSALANALVTLTVNGGVIRKHYTDAGGHYRFTRLHLGAFTITASCAAGYVTQSKVCNITTLQAVDTNFTMLAAGSGNNPNTGSTTQTPGSL